MDVRPLFNWRSLIKNYAFLVVCYFVLRWLLPDWSSWSLWALLLPVVLVLDIAAIYIIEYLTDKR